MLHHLQSGQAKAAITSVLKGERREESESKREVEAGHEAEEVSHFLSCEAVRERGPMRVSRVAATFWAERQVRGGGGVMRRLTCPLPGKKQAQIIITLLAP